MDPQVAEVKVILDLVLASETSKLTLKGIHPNRDTPYGFMWTIFQTTTEIKYKNLFQMEGVLARQ